MIQTSEEMCRLRRTEPIFAAAFHDQQHQKLFEVEEYRPQRGSPYRYN